MKTISKTFNVYSLNELDKNAKNKACDIIRDKLIDDYFYNFKYDCYDILSNNYNLTGFDIEYSLNYCQGDGLCFYAKNKNILSYTNLTTKKDCNAFELYILQEYAKKIDKKEFNLIIEYLNSGYCIYIIKNGFHYSHAYTCSIDYEYYCNNNSELENDVNNAIIKLCKELFDNVYVKICNELEKFGYACYDVSDKDVAEYCDEINYLFYEDGAVYGCE